MAEWFCVWTQAEKEALDNSGIGSVAVALYVTLKFQMDFRSRTVGKHTSISWNELGWAMREDTTRGRGVQQVRMPLQPMRTAIDRLVKAGLLKRIGNADALCFFLPKAKDASVRPNQTQQSGNRGESTEPNSVEPSVDAGLSGIRSMGEKCIGSSNPTHIKKEGRCTPPQSSSTPVNEGGFDSGDDDAGVNRDRAAPSQAGSLGRPGNTQEDPYRDRPAASHASPQGAGFHEESPDRDRAMPSHPAQWRRSGGPAQLSGLLTHPGSNETPVCSAENESTRPVCAGDEAVAALHAVLVRRGLRVPAEDSVVAAWAAERVTPLELDLAITAAVKARQKANSLQPLNVGYVGTIIKSERSAARRAAEAARLAVRQGRAKSDGDKDFEALARSVGMWPAPLGWDWPRLRAEVYRAVDAVRRGDGRGKEA